MDAKPTFHQGGGPRGPGSTSLPEKGRIKLRRDRLVRAGGYRRGGGERPDPGRDGPTKGNRRLSLLRASMLELRGFRGFQRAGNGFQVTAEKQKIAKPPVTTEVATYFLDRDWCSSISRRDNL